ncbi:CoA-binding protein [Aureibaculum sp. 2210JD6-5]|uniref:CoA-binding protein n=1 Tax=Aureibaculum sp. 2210JD6-5 TaxID=3103957 RepID=UPI002AAD83EB|nr:CoA-binding protein [Aureibaculum sp. 2210JD6-5]MDY7393687.1 CoA-binding protein [Aureibaculum sp. 2210JD6-5]
MSKKTLVIGASIKPSRYAYIAIKRLLDKNYDVKAIGSKQGLIGIVRIETGKPQYKDIHTVTLYLNPDRQEEYYDYIIALKPKRVIFNPGTENQEFVDLLKKNKIEAEVACTLVLLSVDEY